MRRDKKVVNGRLHFVLLTRIGETAIVSDVTEAELLGALHAVGLL
jgi:3-dehydroquinate synthetase